MNRTALQVIPGAGDGRKKRLEELYLKYGGMVFGRCRFLLRDDARAEDAMQDVFAKAILNHDQFRGAASPSTWLMKIATHHCLNELRKERSLFRRMFHSTPVEEPEAPSGPQRIEDQQTIRQLMLQFDSETQAVVVHYHVDEMTLEEVAALLGRSVPTIRKRLQNFAEATGKELVR